LRLHLTTLKVLMFFQKKKPAKTTGVVAAERSTMKKAKASNIKAKKQSSNMQSTNAQADFRVMASEENIPAPKALIANRTSLIIDTTIITSKPTLHQH
jgi:hypothetical protein